MAPTIAHSRRTRRSRTRSRVDGRSKRWPTTASTPAPGRCWHVSMRRCAPPRARFSRPHRAPRSSPPIRRFSSAGRVSRQRMSRLSRRSWLGRMTCDGVPTRTRAPPFLRRIVRPRALEATPQSSRNRIAESLLLGPNRRFPWAPRCSRSGSGSRDAGVKLGKRRRCAADRPRAAVHGSGRPQGEGP